MKIIVLTLLMTPEGAIPIKQVERKLKECVWVEDARPKKVPCRWKQGIVTYDKRQNIVSVVVD